jgi:SH3-like domain-containing protein
MGRRFLLSVCLSVGIGSHTYATNVEPYCVTLKAREANVRVGPGSRYPVAWRFVRSGIPLMVLAESGTWRKIRDAEGAEGWVHQNMVVGWRTVVVTSPTCALLTKPDPGASKLASVDPAVCAHLLEISGRWVRVRVERFIGWLPRASVWGVLPEEKDKRF